MQLSSADMKLINMLSTSALLLATFIPVLGATLPAGVQLLNNRAELKFGNYTIVPLTYSGLVGPHEVTYNGTIQQLLNHVETTHPGFNRTSLLTASGPTLERDISNIQKRSLCCPVAGQSFTPADSKSIDSGIGYLSRLPGNCHVPPGPRVCARISCSWNGGIHLCNDNWGPLDIPCALAGRWAGQLSNDCTFPKWDIWETCGQIFQDSDRWNIFITADDC